MMQAAAPKNLQRAIDDKCAAAFVASTKFIVTEGCYKGYSTEYIWVKKNFCY